MRPHMKLGWCSHFAQLAPLSRETSVFSMMSESTCRKDNPWLNYLRSNPYTRNLKPRGTL